MTAMDSIDSDLDEETPMTTTSLHPVPFAILKVQLKRLVQQHRENTHQSQEPQVIATKDLLTVIGAYENEHGVLLLTLDQKTAIQPYTLLDPELEMTSGDILNLLKLVFTCPSPIASIYVPTCQLSEFPRTSAPLKPNSSRRLSLQSINHAVISDDDQVSRPAPIYSVDGGDSNQQPITKQIMDDEVPEEDDVEFVYYYRRSLALTQRLKVSERNLACMTRDNDDQMAALQNRVDEMTNQVGKQKRELLEYKSKETKSLEQIGMLEAHIDTIQKSKTDQNQVYLSIKTLYDEKCGETHKLQELLKQKESDLQQTETFLDDFHHEFMQLTEERNRLAILQQELETELITSQYTHTQLAEQRSENQRLKQVIDTLQYDLDLARREQMSSGLPNTNNLIKSLEDELAGQLRLKKDEDTKTLEQIHQIQQIDKRLESAENEKDYYKSRAAEVFEDLDRVKGELSHLRKTMDSKNWLLTTELDDLATKRKMKSLTTTRQVLSKTIDSFIGNYNNISSNTAITNNDTFITPSSSSPSSTINSSSSVTTADRFIRLSPPSTDVWSQSRIRGKKLGAGKKREIIDLHNASSLSSATTTTLTASSHKQDISPSTRHYQTALANRQKNDKLITGTTTFAIYTLLVYVFGIVTSTFFIENGSPASWEQALMVTAGQSANGNYKLLDILFYWIEKFLFDGDGVALP